MAKPVSRKRVFHPTGGKPSPVNQSASRGGDVMRRLQEQAAGLRPVTHGQFMDLTYTDPDAFIDAMNMVTDIRRRFSALPSRLRAECQNDPRQFLRLHAQAVSGDEVSLAVLKKFGLSVTAPKAPQAPQADPNQVDLLKEADASA